MHLSSLNLFNAYFEQNSDLNKEEEKHERILQHYDITTLFTLKAFVLSLLQRLQANGWTVPQLPIIISYSSTSLGYNLVTILSS